jgi:predicted phage baseplate assembly protein
MKRLAPNLFDRRFDDLLETGRSRLPSLAPRWTDYNAHDPGITLMELLAFVTEAQMYSLARMRRDERAAYAALLGLRGSGPRPATGTLWADRSDSESPFGNFREAIVIEPDATVRVPNGDTPSYHPTHRILWTPGQIAALRTLLADGRVQDHTGVNAQADRAFEPFGPTGGSHDVLRIDFRCRDERGLFPSQRASAAQALWPIGVRVAPALRAVLSDAPVAPATPLAVEIHVGSERMALPVVEDGTRGFMQSGVLLLDLSGVSGSPDSFAIDIHAPRGFARAPRILALDTGVLPIVQGGVEIDEVHTTNGFPDQRLELQQPGLRFGDGASPLLLRIREDDVFHEWQRIDDLSKAGPEDRVFELDTAGQAVMLGNGINGHLPEGDCSVLIDYPYCSGSAGNAPRRERWTVTGIAGTFGVNPDPIAGGRDSDTDLDLRRLARQRLSEAHALVTARDLESAARALPDLEVARAEVVLRSARPDTARELSLIAMRARTTLEEPAEAPETTRWLAAVRRGLVARMPLGVRLDVRAPAYRDFTLRARVEALARRNPSDVDAAIRTRLRDAFALTPRRDVEPRTFGAKVSPRDLAALIRTVPGVRRVISLSMLVDGQPAQVLAPARHGLPRLVLGADSITVERFAGGGA